MVDHPPLCVGVCTCRRPWYAALALKTLHDFLHYDGEIRFHISDGGSSGDDFVAYDEILREHSVTKSVNTNLSDMCNSIAHYGATIWMTIMDDFVLRYPLDITPDVLLLLEDSRIGVVRMNRLSFWGSGSDPQTSGDLISNSTGLHWWMLDKGRTRDPYMSGIGVHLYHRRYWDAYGDIPACDPNHPGEAELNGNKRFWEKAGGPTVAVPMRFGEDYPGHPVEPFWHIGSWRTDEYTASCGRRL